MEREEEVAEKIKSLFWSQDAKVGGSTFASAAAAARVYQGSISFLRSKARIFSIL